jgi:hypothetical protein
MLEALGALRQERRVQARPLHWALEARGPNPKHVSSSSSISWPTRTAKLGVRDMTLPQRVDWLLHP